MGKFDYTDKQLQDIEAFLNEPNGQPQVQPKRPKILELFSIFRYTKNFSKLSLNFPIKHTKITSRPKNHLKSLKSPY